MTESAKRFVTPLSLEIASDNRVLTSVFDDPMAHIRLPSEADVMVVAPATANIVAKFACGLADDLLSTCYLSFRGTALIAPSMNWRMYESPAFQANLKKVISCGAIQVGPDSGSLACGEEGIGRMAGVPEILEAVNDALTEKDLAGERIVVTAGPTREYIDPVRFISNRSSGKMGFALAKAARQRGAEVTLISGPSALGSPAGVRLIRTETSAEMMAAVRNAVSDATVLIMAAAVSDFSPALKSGTKVEKTGDLTLKLRKTEDIISSVSSAEKRPFIVGFAAETGGDTARTVEKMKTKNMDMIVFNDVTEPGAGFDVDTNKVVIIDKNGQMPLKLMSKDRVALAILDRILEIKT